MLRISDSPQTSVRDRFAVATILVAILFGSLVVRVWYLQILQGRKFTQFSEQNRISVKKIPAMRGRILDRNGIVIADSRPSFDLTMVSSRLDGSRQDNVDRLAAILGWDADVRRRILSKLAASSPNDAVVVQRDMSRDDLARFLAREHSFRGITVEPSPARSYPFGRHGSHLLGYLGEINKPQFEELRKKEETFYQLGDVWGIAGVEKAFETSLRGVSGARPFVEDAWGREIGEAFSSDLLPEFQRRDPMPGNDLVLALDAKTQEAAETAFTYDAGAVVALEPKTGDVLALISRPEYDPAEFVRGVSSSYWGDLNRDPLKPLYDRTLQGLYPPGSTFKIVTMAAILEEKVLGLNETVYCPGHYKLGRETKSCWQKKGHGPMSLLPGLQHSCDVYFYESGRRLGVDRIAKYAKSLGLGEKTGIGINREEAGLVPTEEWKQKVYKQPWVGGETLSVAIGQGALQVSPLQMAVMLAAVVNGGKLITPRVALRAQAEDGQPSTVFETKVKRDVPISKEDRGLIMKAMGMVVNEPGGTAYWGGRSKYVAIGGKTGTAQVVSLRARTKVQDHAWFVAFAPIDDPKIVVSVLAENAGHGSTAAAPIARAVIEAYLGLGEPKPELEEAK